jgi:SpoVK/Ycf46/Vps4 family AAA+-type ATPase
MAGPGRLEGEQTIYASREKEANGTKPRRAKRRSQNPLISNVEQSTAGISSFAVALEELIKSRNGLAAENIHTQLVSNEDGDWRDICVSIPFKYTGLTDAQLVSLKRLVSTVAGTDKLQEKAIKHKDQKYWMVTTDTIEVESDLDFLKNGLFFDQEDSHDAGIPRSGILSLRHNITDGEAPSETMMVYESVMVSLILAGKIDISTAEREKESLGFRKNLFMDIYQNMLSEYMPGVSREQLLGVDEQIDDIDTNLYAPLKSGEGTPMNSLLVGAPGTGKSMMGRHFMTDRDVLTVPLGIEKLGSLEHGILDEVIKLKSMFGLPAVIFFDDIEGLLEEGMSRTVGGVTTQSIDAAARSKALSLLDRMADTYEVYMFCTLNHPDVEAAFLRRFNPVYFPLPTEHQRRHFLQATIPQRNLDEETYESLVDQLTNDSEGHNYNGLALINAYLENLLSKEGAPVDQARYLELVYMARRKAKQRIDVAGLKRFDDAAKQMVQKDV